MAEQPLRGKERLSLLDALRGFALLNMILYHILYDIVYIFGHPMPDMYGNSLFAGVLFYCQVSVFR